LNTTAVIGRKGSIRTKLRNGGQWIRRALIAGRGGSSKEGQLLVTGRGGKRTFLFHEDTSTSPIRDRGRSLIPVESWQEKRSGCISLVGWWFQGLGTQMRNRKFSKDVEPFWRHEDLQAKCPDPERKSFVPTDGSADRKRKKTTTRKKEGTRKRLCITSAAKLLTTIDEGKKAGETDTVGRGGKA